MMLDNKKFTAALRGFEEQALNLHKKLDAISGHIIGIEQEWNKFGVHFPIKVMVFNNGPIVFISWERCESSNKWRLFLTECNGDIETKKPFIETKYDKRLAYFPYMENFIEEATDQLKEHLNKLGL